LAGFWVQLIISCIVNQCLNMDILCHILTN
jgi:hypothetical protein